MIYVDMHNVRHLRYVINVSAGHMGLILSNLGVILKIVKHWMKRNPNKDLFCGG